MTALEAIGIVAACLAVAGGFALRDPRARAASMLAALVLTPALLLGELWDSDQLDVVRDHPPAAIAAGLAGLGLAAALAAGLLRRPAALALLAVGALPFRVPVDTGAGDPANLLVPLYIVVAAGVIAYAWDRLRGREARVAPREAPAGAVELALLAAVVLYAAQAAYSSDFEAALKNVVFFYIPFALLLRLLAGVAWSRRLAAACLALPVSLALVFAGIGFWEYAARELLWNPKVVASNQFESYFRVNSLFFDPNIYGRFLAIVMIGLAAVLLWGERRRDLLVAAAALAVLWGGLVLTFSQSSFGALLVGLGVLAALRWGARPVLVVTAGAAVAGLVLVLAAPGLVRLDPGDERSLDAASSGRISLMRGGAEMFLDRPLAGFGSGSFAREFREREEVSSEEAASASHTIPITVAAEQGILGLGAYLLVLWTAFGLVLRGPFGVVRAFVAAAFAALVFHTLLYAAFLEDPITWTLLGAAIGLRARTRTGSSSP
ncbi:MAG: O-antigen ligase family protein [Thermoleophilaceae bacterium]